MNKDYNIVLFRMFKGLARKLEYFDVLRNEDVCLELYRDALTKLFGSKVGEDLKGRFHGLILETEIPVQLRNYIWRTFRSVLSDYVQADSYMHSEYSISGRLEEKKAIIEFELREEHMETFSSFSQNHLSQDPAIQNAAEICFSKINPDKRDLLSLSFIEEESLRAIAKRLRTNHEWIRQEIKRVLNQIRKKMKELIPDATGDEAHQVWDLIKEKLIEWCEGNYER